jgi:hypothetical protein
MQSLGSVPLASFALMKLVLEHRTYEQHGDEWVEIDAAQARQPRPTGFAALAKTAFGLAAITAVGIVAAAVALVLLPVAFLAAWWLRAVSRTETRRPQ